MEKYYWPSMNDSDDYWQLPPLNYSGIAWMTNSTDDALSTRKTLVDRLLTQLVVPVVISVIVALGLVGNLSVIIVVAANSQMRSSSANTLIASLAVVDLVFCVICLPVVAAVNATGTWPFGDVWCKVCRLLILITKSRYFDLIVL